MSRKSLAGETDTSLRLNRNRLGRGDLQGRQTASPGRRRPLQFRRCLAAALLFTILLVLVLLRFTPYPELRRFLERQYSCRIYDRRGELVQVTALENGVRREWTDLDKMPNDVRRYFLRSEDRRFYLHNGVDWLSAASAFADNARSGRTVRGASTVTMQLVRIINSENRGKRTLAVKLREVLDAYRLEARLTKGRILELYLNNVPFGMNVEGVTSAARSFYGKEVNQLSREEICCLAVIPRSPSANNPVNNPENCAHKAVYLQRNRGDASSQDLDRFLAAASSAFKYQYPYYMPHYVRQLAPTQPEVHLSADLSLQNYAQSLALKALEDAHDSRISNAAVYAINNQDGSTLVWLGNASWYDSDGGQLDGVLATNQPGSSMKPFLYALALERKNKGKPEQSLFLPTTVLADVPREFGSQQLYIPANFNNQFNGPVRFRVALASSLNIPAVSILNDIGVDSYLEKLEKLGFASLGQTGKQADLGLALGAGEVSLKELVEAFSVFPRDGLSLDGQRIYDCDTARIICSILSDKSARATGFGYSQTFETDFPSIFKTGTSNQYQSIVALGATRRWTVGVWMGNFSGATVMGKTGSSLPASIAKSILEALEKASPLPAEELAFPEPENWSMKKICSLSGMGAGPDCPNTVYEYVKNGTSLEVCSWHKAGGQVAYPSEYQQWFRTKRLAGEIDWSDSPLKIMTPQNNSLFYYSPADYERQQVLLEVTGRSGSQLEVFYDHRLIEKLQRPFVCSLPVERGEHIVEVVCGSERQSLAFEVK